MLAPIVAQKRLPSLSGRANKRHSTLSNAPKLPKKLLTTGKGHIKKIFFLFPFFKSQQRCRMPHILLVPVKFFIIILYPRCSLWTYIRNLNLIKKIMSHIASIWSRDVLPFLTEHGKHERESVVHVLSYLIH